MHLTELTSTLTAGQSTGIALGVSLAYLATLAVYYVWVALALSRLFAKLGEPSWKGWVPVVNQLTLFTLGGYSGLWVISLFFPLVQLAGLVVLCFAIHAINRQFGKGAGFTVLGILLFPIWASVLGFGRAQPVGGRQTDAAGQPAPSPFESRMAGLAPVAGDFPAMSPSASFAAPAPDPVIFRPVPVAAPVPPIPVAPPVPPAPPVPSPPVVEPVAAAAPPAPVSPARAEAAPVSDPWAPPISSIPGFELPDATSVPHSAVAPATAPALASPADSPINGEAPNEFGTDKFGTDKFNTDEFDTDETVLKKRGPKWSLQLPDGATVPLTNAIVLLGRNPSATGDSVGAQLVALSDPSKTMSKTHARLALADGAWTITDLSSTNGTAIVGGAGEEIELDAGVATSVTSGFTLGQFTVQLRREG